MYYELKKGLLREITEKAFRKAGNIYKLAKMIKLNRTALSMYHLEKRRITDINLAELESFLKIKIKEKDILKKLPNNWKQIIGGKNCTEKKREKGTLNNQLKEARKKIPYEKSAKAWHAKMKRDNPDQYHLIQYERFKKIGGYKFLTKKGEKVRNLLEKQTADILFDNKIEYEYEKMIKLDNQYFFPDFIVNNKTIIECTAWRGYDKAIKLKKKIDILKNKYNIYVLIPKALNNYYKILNNHLILGLDEFVPLAQTFRDAN